MSRASGGWTEEIWGVWHKTHHGITAVIEPVKNGWSLSVYEAIEDELIDFRANYRTMYQAKKEGNQLLIGYEAFFRDKYGPPPWQSMFPD
jgi:hypothetical protein